MPGQFRFNLLTVLSLGTLLLLTAITAGQGSPAPLLRLQRQKAYLNLETNVVHAQGLNGITYGKSGSVYSYPNTLACLLVFGDGKYMLEKRDEATVGKPKVKLAEGTLGADDLQHLRTILDDEALKKVSTHETPALPDNADTIRESESVDAQIDHAGTLQHFTTTKLRVKLRATDTGGVTNGMDAYLDSGASSQKALNPLLKWFDGLEKKNKSQLKDSSPQYCTPMNIG
jgi:hypothetical protein